MSGYPPVHKLATVHSWAYIQDISSSSPLDNSATKSAEFYGRLTRAAGQASSAVVGLQRRPTNKSYRKT